MRNAVKSIASSGERRKEKRARDGSIYESNGRIYARLQFTGADGRRRDKKIAAESRTHARALLKRMRADLEAHGERSLDAHRMTFRDVAEIYQKVKLVPAVYANERKVAGLRSWRQTRSFMPALIAAFGRRQLRAIKHSDLEAYKLKRLSQPTIKERPRAIASVNRELELLRAILRFAQREGYIVKSPFETGAPVISKAIETRRERVLSFDEEVRLLAACTGRRAHLRALLIAALERGDAARRTV